LQQESTVCRQAAPKIASLCVTARVIARAARLVSQQEGGTQGKVEGGSWRDQVLWQGSTGVKANRSMAQQRMFVASAE